MGFPYFMVECPEVQGLSSGGEECNIRMTHVQATWRECNLGKYDLRTNRCVSSGGLVYLVAFGYRCGQWRRDWRS